MPGKVSCATRAHARLPAPRDGLLLLFLLRRRCELLVVLKAPDVTVSLISHLLHVVAQLPARVVARLRALGAPEPVLLGMVVLMLSLLMLRRRHALLGSRHRVEDTKSTVSPRASQVISAPISGEFRSL
jgi:hypothetical protein